MRASRWRSHRRLLPPETRRTGARLPFTLTYCIARSKRVRRYPRVALALFQPRAAQIRWPHFKVTRRDSTTPYQGWAASRTPAFPSSALHMPQCGLVPQCQRHFGRCASCCTPSVSMTECVRSLCSPRRVAPVSCGMADSRSWRGKPHRCRTCRSTRSTQLKAQAQPAKQLGTSPRARASMLRTPLHLRMPQCGPSFTSGT